MAQNKNKNKNAPPQQAANTAMDAAPTPEGPMQDDVEADTKNTPAIPQTVEAENLSIAVAEKDEQLKKLTAENAALKGPKGIGSIEQRDSKGLLVRPDEQMKTTLADAVLKDPGDYTDEDKIAMEREIRRYVKKGGAKRDPVTGSFLTQPTTGESVLIPGGWRKGISEAQKKRASIFLKRMGRDPENPTWDESIIVPGFQEGSQSQV